MVTITRKTQAKLSEKPLDSQNFADMANFGQNQQHFGLPENTVIRETTPNNQQKIDIMSENGQIAGKSVSDTENRPAEAHQSAPTIEEMAERLSLGSQNDAPVGNVSGNVYINSGKNSETKGA